MLTKKRVGPDGKGYAVIVVLPDGSVEAHLYRHGRTLESKGAEAEEEFEFCAQSDKLSTLESIIDEELRTLVVEGTRITGA